MVKSAPAPQPKEFTSEFPGQRSPEWERLALDNEYQMYEGPGPVKESPFIRKLHDVVGPWEWVENRGTARYDKISEDPPCLIFEWMDHVLWDVRSEPYRQRSVLPKVIAGSVLKGLDLFSTASAMHTGKLSALDVAVVVLTGSDVNPENMFMSNIDNTSPVVKLGDLGNCM